MVPDSAAIDTAVIALLQADPELAAMVPDGVFYDLAPPNATRFVIVSLIEAADVDAFTGTRAAEHTAYLVNAVGLSTAMTDAQVNAARYRIDQLLSDQPLTVPGYAAATVHRDPNRPRERFKRPTTADASIAWIMHGGVYRVHASMPD